MRRVVAALAAFGCMSAIHAAPPSGDGVPPRAPPQEQTRPTTEGLAKALALRATRTHSVRLAPPAVEKLAQVGRPSRAAPLKVGIGRPIPELQTEAATSGALEWERLSDGSLVADVSITSAGASAIRAALRISSLPDDAVLRFKGPADEKLFDVSGLQVNAAIARNLDSGDTTDDARMYWSPVIDGDTVIVEIELPKGADPQRLQVAMPQASHLVTSAQTSFSTPTLLGQSATCEVDAMCSTGWGNEMNAVAEMLFSDLSGTYLCTGTLLSDQDASTSIPYFLTANHCMSSQTAASNLTTYWFYRSSTCGSATPGPYQQLTGGATLLYNSLTSDPVYTDTSFMRLANTPPQGTYFAGWYAGTTPPVGTAVTGLHHPYGDLLKISQGAISGYQNCTPPTNGAFNCSPASGSGSGFYEFTWSSGITEPGSSGSGIFRSDGTLIGQLYGGSGDCTAPGGDVYGRFDVAYNAALKNWLSAPLALQVSKSGTGTLTVGSSPGGISCGGTCSAAFPPGSTVTLAATPAAGTTFNGWGGACSGTGTCTVTMNAPRSVSASFTGSAALAVSKLGTGSVTSAPAGIDCGATCSAPYTIGTPVTLTATPATGSVFKGWSGSCSGTGSCAVTMDAAHSVTATFGPPPSADLALTQTATPSPAVAGKDVVYTLTVTNNGPDSATNVTVTDTLPAGSTFVWASPHCANASGTVTCAAATLASSVQFQVVARPAAAGSITSNASVTATEADPAPGNNASSVGVVVDAAPAASIVTRYRLYSPVTQEHLFTTDLNEYDTLGTQTQTWTQEGPSGKVLASPGSFNGVTAEPYYRLYNPATRWHHWTTDPNEYYTLANGGGWNGEGVDGYILPTGTTGATQLYRLLYPDGRGLHHWTIDPNEYAALIASFGWIGEGGSGFVVQ